MKTFKKIVPPVVSFFFILLFIYASASKMLDFENFQVQLAQSPLLSAYAGFISYGVIILELVIVGLLCFNLTRLWGLYASFAIMVAFTVYIFLILNYSDFVPCSCGGILEKMGWTEHLIFNTACVVTAGLAAIAAHPFPPKAPIREVTEDEWMANYWQRRKDRRMIAYKMVMLLVLPAGLMVALFLSSEHIIKKENNFTRRFLMHPIIEKKSLKLDDKYFYFAGSNDSVIFLGNRKVPQTIAIIDTSLSTINKILIRLDNMNLPFKKLQLQVFDDYYYLYDGTIPIIFQGRIGHSQAKTISYKDAFFTQLEVIDSLKFALRTQSKSTNQLTIAKLDLSSKTKKLSLFPNILQKQIDGVFDSDGTFVTDYNSGYHAYLYTYRNQFTVMDDNLRVIKSLKTIDTISKAQIEVKQLSNGAHKMLSPALKVNLRSTFHRGVVFNQSNLKGKYEKLEIWKDTNVVDVYSTNESKYIGSFYIHKKQKKGISDFLATDENLYVIIDDEMIQYRFTQPILKYFKTGDAENLNKE